MARARSIFIWITVVVSLFETTPAFGQSQVFPELMNFIPSLQAAPKKDDDAPYVQSKNSSSIELMAPTNPTADEMVDKTSAPADSR